VTRFQKLAAATVVTAILLVAVGVIVRVTGSGLGCPDWPLCNGRIIPALDDPKAWIEWMHRTVAVIIGFEVIGLAVLAFLDHRDRRVLLGATVIAVLLVGFQAWLGRETVRLGNSGESVTAHLASAMALVGLLVWILARSLYPAPMSGGGSQRFTLVAAFGAGSVCCCSGRTSPRPRNGSSSGIGRSWAGRPSRSSPMPTPPRCFTAGLL
jgi:heme A synthase